MALMSASLTSLHFRGMQCSYRPSSLGILAQSERPILFFSAAWAAMLSIRSFHREGEVKAAFVMNAIELQRSGTWDRES